MEVPLLAMIAAPLATFTAEVLSSILHKAVIAGRRRQAFTMGSLVEAAEVLVITAVASHTSVTVAVLAALGAGLGWVAGMAIHDRMNHQHYKKQKQRRRAKERKRVQRLVNEALRASR